MDGFNIPNIWFIVYVSPPRSGWSQAIDHKLSQVSSLDQVTYLLFQQEIVLYVMDMILVKLTILVLVSL